ncbi:maleylpyruvate isomerase family mycothiol-dependent enzyme [Streptomyces marispadix]|uniref:Maleylpyruvate isomerase family mycothiol-dependent enzyme n=1 Tax=Streptomyces marispadix TaxID=2922868 RepID=A0ABS9T455_9ACTN|nr:maleylpyruvate isomerase family mycothiol-dependent enzyme [Streptomyces marispadix]MCH6163319.1 maleylpyruvate isomerase family mycothiol-dependent enzyme [Streptomyces marispadix]
MSRLSYDRHCAEIVTQARLLRSCIDGADLTTPVPSCPGWNAGQLVRHLGGGMSWVEEMVRTRAAAPLPDDHFRDLSAYAHEDPAVVGPWLEANAERLAATLREAGPDAAMWTPLSGGTVRFFARRFAHETLVHRADAVLALGQEFTTEPDVAVDAVDEWMELGSLPEMFDFHPERRELLGPGRTIRFRATDVPSAAHAEAEWPRAQWIVDLTGDALSWRRPPKDAPGERAAVTVSGPLTALLLLIYRRRTAPAQPSMPGAAGEGIEVTGDEQLLHFWLDRVGFN